VKLWLLRHARVELAPGLCYGATDIAADEAETRLAAQAAAATLPLGLGVRVSGLRRAGQMAEALGALRPDLGPAQRDPRLNEMDFGTFELQPWDAIPRDAIDLWVADFARHRFGGVESTQEVINRVGQALVEPCALGGPAHEVLWITHAGVIRAATYIAQHGLHRQVEVDLWPAVAPPPGGLTCIELHLG
jgi:alpha-ribazole phosphatase